MRKGSRDLFGEERKDTMEVHEITDRGMQICINGTWFTALELQGGRVDFTPIYGVERLCMPIMTYAAACKTVHAILDDRRAKAAVNKLESPVEDKKQNALF